MDLLRVDPYGLPRCLEGIQGRPLWKRTSRVVIFLREASWSHWARPVLLRSARAQAAMLQRKLILQLQPRPTPLPKLRPCIAATAPLTETSALRAWLSPRPKTVPSSPPAWMTISSCLLIRRASRPCRTPTLDLRTVTRGQGAHVEDGEQRCLFGQHEGESPVHHAVVDVDEGDRGVLRGQEGLRSDEDEPRCRDGSHLVERAQLSEARVRGRRERRHHHDGCVCRRRFRPQDGTRHRGCSR